MTASAGSLDILVTADTAEASSSLSKFAANAEREMQRTARASQQAQRESDRMTAGLQKQIDTFGMTGSEIQKYEMRLKGASAAQLEMVDRLQRMKDAASAFNSTANEGGGLGGAAEGIKKSAHEMEGFSFQTAGAKRELLVLAHELSQGNFKQFGGSMLVLGERTGAASLLFSGLGVAALAAVGAFAGLAYEIFKGAQALEEFNKHALLTGNFAGLTPETFQKTAASVSGIGTGTQSHTQEALQAVASTGVFGPENIQAATEAVARYSALTGETADKVAAEFAKMGDGVAKYAFEHDKSMHLLTGAEYEQIKALEEAGKATEAQGVYFGALNERLREHDKEISEVGKYWQAVKIVVDEYIQAVRGIGSLPTIGKSLQFEREKLADLEKSQGSSFRFRDFSGDIEQTKQTIAALESSQQLAANVAKTNAAVLADQDARKSASNDLDKRREALRGINNEQRELNKLQKEEDAIRRGGGTIDPAEHDAMVAKIKKDNAPKGGGHGRSDQDKLESAYDKAMSSMGAENAKLDAEIDSWERFGKAIDKSRLAVALFDIAQGKLKGKGGAELTMSEKAAYLEQAAIVDAKQATLEQDKAIAADKKRTESIESVANAQAMNARETKIATEIAGLQTKKGTEGYEALALARTKAVNAEFDSRLNQQLDAQRQATQDEIAGLEAQTRLIGLSTVERLKDAAARKLQAQADKDIAANPGQTAQILDAMIERRNALTEAIQKNYDAARTADAGVATALQKYQEEATNYAKSANELTSKVLSGLEDGLTALLTGKKFNFKAFVDSIISEIIRLQVVKPLLASIFGGGQEGSGALGGIGGTALRGAFGGGQQDGGGLIGSLGGLFSGAMGSSGNVQGIGDNYNGSGGWLGLVSSLGAAFLDEGTNYVPYDGMPAVLHKGEAVVPARYNQGAGNSARPVQVTNHFTVNGATDRSSQAQIASAAGAGIQRAMARNL